PDRRPGAAASRPRRRRRPAENFPAPRGDAAFTRRAGDAGQRWRPPPFARKRHRAAAAHRRRTHLTGPAMLSVLFHSLLFAQAAATPVPLEQVRLDLCLDQARADPGAAMIEASGWLAETSGADASYPQQCLGYAYTLLLNWNAAESAFLAAREAEFEANHFRRAQLA